MERVNTGIAQKIKEIRKRDGLSQEMLAEMSGLSLRTVQRIEMGKTEPRGDTLRRIAVTLNVRPDEFTAKTTFEDREFLAALNLSSLGFLLFPLLGVIIPFIIWIFRKDKTEKINNVGRDIFNFQLSWSILALGLYLFFAGRTFYRIQQAGDISPSITGNPAIVFGIFGFLYVCNLIMIVINTMRIMSGKETRYVPVIRFFR